MINEPLSQYFLNKLESDEKPFITLTVFFCSAFGIKATPEFFKMFNKLTKMYDKYLIFFAILDVYDMPNVNELTNSYKMQALLSYFIKKKFKSSEPTHVLTEILNDNKLRRQEINKTKLIIPNPFKGETVD